MVDRSGLTEPNRRAAVPVRRRGPLAPPTAGVLAACVLVLLVTAFVVGPWLTPHTVSGVDTQTLGAAPSWRHPFGTDPIGRDVFTRTLAGGRTTLLTAVIVAGLATLIGLVAGAAAGYRGGFVDTLVSQVVNLTLLTPALVVLLVVAVRFATTPVGVAILLAVLLWPTTARVVRAEVLALKSAEFVAGAEAVGASTWRILRHHLLPHLVGVITVNATLLLATAVVLESTLAFLGLGTAPPTPTLGGLVGAGRSQLESNPVVVLGPAGVIVALTLSVHVLGDRLQAVFRGRGGR